MVQLMNTTDPRLLEMILPLLARCERLSGELIQERLSGFGLSYGEFRLLGHLSGEAAGLNQKVLAARMGLDPSSISVALVPLERQGLVKRTRDPKDRRNVIVRLTTSHAQFLRVIDEIAEIERVIAATLGKDDMAALKRLLSAVISALNTLKLEQWQPPGQPERRPETEA
jgi:DNA-binding MarR family transcriptional regulator